MDEIVDLLKYIAVKLNDIENEIGAVKEEINSLQGVGIYNSIADITDKLDEIKGAGLFNSISDTNDRLEEIGRDLSNIDMKID